MTNYIDIGIDFGAENIVIIAVGYDNKNRSDYKLISLDTNNSIKNYLGLKSDGSIDIGQNAKTAYLYNNQNNEYKWVSGRYKLYIKEDNNNQFVIEPDELLKLGLHEIIKRLENFDFSLILSGQLRNITVGIPQAWDTNKKDLYRKIMSVWQSGNVNLLPEPVAATIAAYKRSAIDLSEKIIMIIDIGASTLDISFSKYSNENKNLEVYKTTYRSKFAGHYFDIILAAFTLLNESNKLAINEVIDRLTKIKLRKVEDFIEYISKNQSKYSTLLLELENIKENSINEIIKFNRKKLIDLGNKYAITVNKQIFQEALKYYSEKISKDINNLLDLFKKQENISSEIYPFLCGGASSLNSLEKSLKEQINKSEAKNLFSIIKEGDGNKIDTTIATGLAYYAQDNSIISKKLDLSISTNFIVDNEMQDFIIFSEGSSYPLKEPKRFSSLIGDNQFFEYHGDNTGKIEFPINFKNNEYENNKIITVEFPDAKTGDEFDLQFNIDIEDNLNIKVINSSQDKGLLSKININSLSD